MKIIFSTNFGSHLYGTNSESSDKDIKGIFKAELSDIVLKTDRETVHQNTKSSSSGKRNTSEDTDIEYKELRRFIYDCLSGQTYALDMLFSPERMWLQSSDIWCDIIRNRYKLLSKNIRPYLSYCNHQAGKYGLKGSRLGELLRVIDYLKLQNPKSSLADVMEGLEVSEYVVKTSFELPRKNLPTLTQNFLEVLGKKMDVNRQISECLPVLENLNERYGDRAKLAQVNEGIDWKAVSHAFRCCYQLIELAETGFIKFPLRQAEYLKDIKYGKIPYVDLQDKLVALMEEAKDSVERSALPDSPDTDFWNSYIINLYTKHD